MTLNANGEVVRASTTNAIGPLVRPARLGDTATIGTEKIQVGAAGAAIARMAEVEVNASSQYITLSAGTKKGRALSAAGAPVGGQPQAFTLLVYKN